MSSTKKQIHAEQREARIRAFILEIVESVPRNLPLHVSHSLCIPSTEVYTQIHCMVSEGLLTAEGRTSARRYEITARGEAYRDGLGKRLLPNGARNSDAELLTREPRTLQEAERKTWLLRRGTGPHTKTSGQR